MSAASVSPRALHPVVCVIDALHRDLAVAEDARRGRFTHAGATLELGRHPDWLHDGLAGDEEWRIEWVKLYEGLDLAHAFSLTGDRDHLAAWEDLVEEFVEQVPVGHDTSDVDARRMQNWIYAWQRFAAADGFDGLRHGLAERVTDRLAADAAHLRDHLTAERNHRTLELYALLVVGIALGDRSLAADALVLLGENAAADIGPEGVQRERSSDYHMIVLRSLIGAIANGRAVGQPIPSELAHRAHLACTFGLHLQRPDGTTPALSDGDQADFRPLLADAAALLGRPDLLWAATRGVAGAPPPDRHASFPVGGYVTQRSGWGDRGRAYGDERWAVLDCGPLGDGGHGHYDHLSVELAAGAHRLAVDPGRYTYADTPWRHWFKGTAGHNTVTVDGLDQQPYRRGRPKGAQSSAALIARHGAETGPCLDVVIARCTSPSYDAVHTRTLAFVDDTYWIVHDLLDAPTPHDYVCRWHLDVAAHDRARATTAGDLTVVTVPGGTFAVASGPAVSLDAGWVSPTYGVKHPAPVLTIAAPRAPTTTFVTVVTPGSEAPVAIDAVDGTVRVRWAGRVDVVAWTAATASLERTPC